MLIIIASAVLIFLLFAWICFSYLKTTDAYAASVDYSYSNAYCENPADCTLRGGIIFDKKAAFPVNGNTYNVFADYYNNRWNIYCRLPPALEYN